MNVNYLFLLLLIFLSTFSQASTKIEVFTTSQSFSNILPVKQLITDNWRQSPKKNASDGFTQNEVGMSSYWQHLSLSVAQRYDYFVYSNPDTAKVFYLDKNDLALDTQEEYHIALKLFHQRSNGLRIGYKYEFENFSSEIRLGYWDLNVTRESNLTGTLASDLNGNISAIAQLDEFYTANNFLKRRNSNDWDADGTGITIDIHLRWQLSQYLSINADLKDIYNHFTVDESGFSAGNIDTDGTFINSVGGVAYLPVYRGKETTSKHQFKLPKQLSFIGFYHHSEQISYLARYKRQGEQNFYYLGFDIAHENSSTRISFDIENNAPEIQYKNDWLSVTFAIDSLKIEQAMLLNLGFNLYYRF
ncbi:MULTISPECIES: hypothetical protein [unclassified Colwellia]|uniref:hypothetical protein n=1 Tax=unclassified Colwellia TaxID=196834 RepID=UPI0015F47CA0|nr:MULTISPECIES: hypothetical protein [unclassified Colwellia]MBA6351710.1 hypothetical protein [Colwellia sp. BRX9-1]MBA6356714.1 hypothetical protein [Colwellia sp. BRX8-3]MBA6359043.1 hypothetical protein [Colwellia sp. BRX8-6]MBA6369259.1 hypothetical protein [Colwellia sp. BRX8-5]MBA6375322.1 hypothetical protein [Colwellia sp. BRX8-2]|tara:strand:- start:3868 stop:4947 length:1080 start_codon:yes stop_codon:yes gene_type:complete